MAESDLKFEYHPEAVAEASEAFEWYFNRSRLAAENFSKELLRARISVTEQPDIWPPYFHDTQCFRFRRFPYGLVYFQKGTLVVGLAVVHFKRRPGYWRHRLAK